MDPCTQALHTDKKLMALYQEQDPAQRLHTWNVTHSCYQEDNEFYRTEYNYTQDRVEFYLHQVMNYHNDDYDTCYWSYSYYTHHKRVTHACWLSPQSQQVMEDPRVIKRSLQHVDDQIQHLTNLYESLMEEARDVQRELGDLAKKGDDLEDLLHKFSHQDA